MRIAVLGAGGGLGRNIVDAALAANHQVVALVRDPKRAELPPNVTTVVGDAERREDLIGCMDGTDAAMFCIMPPLAKWLSTFRDLLAAAISAARQTRTRLVFPGNVWIYGPGVPGELVDEARRPSPTSARGRLRAQMEEQLRGASIRHAIVRLPEFFGPRVTTLTAPVFRAAIADRRALWPGPLDVEIELVYMPDAARALLDVATSDGTDGEQFHLPGVRTTPWNFANEAYQAAGHKPRISAVPRPLLCAAGVFNATLRAVSDISHLWTKPVLLDGSKYAARFGGVPMTPMGEAIAATLAWHRKHPGLQIVRKHLFAGSKPKPAMDGN